MNFKVFKHCIISNAAVAILTIFITSCTTVRVTDDFIVHENLYSTSVIKNNNWLILPPTQELDTAYIRCPEGQIIAITYKMLCYKYDYDHISSSDIADRIYKNDYFSSGLNMLCPSDYTLADKNIIRILDTSINKDKKQFTIVYETKQIGICGMSTSMTPVKIMDVFMEDQKEYFWGAMHSRFVIFRYVSPIDKYDSGINNFSHMISNFKWL